MAQSKESKLWNQINKLDRKWHFTRIESSTINGIPDVHAVCNNKVFWVELKSDYVSYPKLSKWQIVWINKYIKAGGKVFILVEDLLERVLKLYEPVSVFTDPRLLKPRCSFSLTGQWPAIQAELLDPAQQRLP